MPRQCPCQCQCQCPCPCPCQCECQCLCSLVREIRQLKEQVALGADAAAADGAAAEADPEENPEAALAVAQLANMLRALASHVSLLHERTHEALLSQVLGLQLWTAPQVCSFTRIPFAHDMIPVSARFRLSCSKIPFTASHAMALNSTGCHGTACHAISCIGRCHCMHGHIGHASGAA